MLERNPDWPEEQEESLEEQIKQRVQRATAASESEAICPTCKGRMELVCDQTGEREHYHCWPCHEHEKLKQQLTASEERVRELERELETTHSVMEQHVMKSTRMERELAAAKEEKYGLKRQVEMDSVRFEEMQTAGAKLEQENATLREDKRVLEERLSRMDEASCRDIAELRKLRVQIDRPDAATATQGTPPKLGILRNNGVRGPGYREWYEPVVEIPQTPTQEDSKQYGSVLEEGFYRNQAPQEDAR